MKLLFVPVSAPRGRGEYARSCEIAREIIGRHPGSEVRFVLNRAAPYAADAPFPAVLLPSSPTFHPREVAELIRSYGPDVVVFDNAGRTAHLRAAREAGARIVYISSRRRQRRKAFRLRWMRLIDEHWIAYPPFVAGPLSLLERSKLRWLRGPTLRYLDTILPKPDPGACTSIRARLELEADGYTLIVLGGGTSHPGAEHAPRVAADAAARLARRGYRTVLVGNAGGGDAPRDSPALLTCTPILTMAELAVLIREARLVISNGGDTLLQVLACARPCIACPVAHDQADRIEHCAAAGLVTAVTLQAEALERAATALLGDPRRAADQVARLARYPIRNGIDMAVEAIAALAAR